MGYMNRNDQNKILEYLHSRFPSSVSSKQFTDVFDLDEKLIANLMYLSEQGFLKASLSGTGFAMMLEAIEITGLGLAEAEGFNR